MNNQQIGRDEKINVTFSKADRYLQLGEAENGNSEALQNCRFSQGEGPPRQRSLRACVCVRASVRVRLGSTSAVRESLATLM